MEGSAAEDAAAREGEHVDDPILLRAYQGLVALWVMTVAKKCSLAACESVVATVDD